MHLEQFTIPGSLPLADIAPLVVDEKSNIPEEIKKLNRLQKTVRLPDKQLTALLGAMGAFRRNPDRLEATVISHTQVSAWKSGRERMPRWRLAEAVVLIEFLGCLREREAQTILDSEANEIRKRLADMQIRTFTHVLPDLKYLQQQTDLQEFLPPFRRALYRRLEADAHLSPADQERFDLWRECVGEGETKKSGSKKHGKKRTRQAA